MGAQLGSVIAGLAFAALTFLVFYAVVLREERLLMKRYKMAYVRYLTTVPRFLPNPRLWRDIETVTVTPSRVLQTFGSAMLLLVAIPVAETFEHLQQAGILPVLFYRP